MDKNHGISLSGLVNFVADLLLLILPQSSAVAAASHLIRLQALRTVGSSFIWLILQIRFPSAISLSRDSSNGSRPASMADTTRKSPP